MTRIWTGTAQVISGYTTVIVTSGDPLSDANCPADASCVLDGRGHFVASRTSTTEFELTTAWEGDDGVVTLEIDPLNPNAISLVSLSRQITEYDARTALIDANGRGLFYKSLGDTAANDPGPGFMGRDDDDWTLVQNLYFDVLDQNGQNVSDQLNLFTPGDVLIARSIDTNAVARYRVQSTTDLSGWYVVAVEYLGGSDIIADDEDLAVEWRRVGVGVEYNTQVDAPADLIALEGQAIGYKVLVSDYDGNGRAAVVTLLESGSPTGWSAPAYITGPQGTGTAATIAVGTVVGLAPGETPTVENVGTSSDAVLNFGIPEGQQGAPGTPGAPGDAATIAVGSTTTLDPGEEATVENVGTSSDAVLNFGIPQGSGLDYDFRVDTVAGLADYENEAAGTRVLVTDSGVNSRAAIFELVTPGSPSSWSSPIFVTGAKGDPGSVENISADDVSYDPDSESPSSGLLAANVQQALDGLAALKAWLSGADFTGTVTVPRLGVNAVPDDDNPVSMTIAKALFSAVYDANEGDGSLRFTLNKEAEEDVLSFLFQRDFDARAEFGLIGNDHFEIKVKPGGESPDVWYSGIVIDKDTGEVTFPNTPVVMGPASATDKAVPRFDGATGKLIEESLLLVDDTGSLNTPHQTTPASPGAGRVKVYAKNDDKLYKVNSGGTERQLLDAGDLGVTVQGYDADLAAFAGVSNGLVARTGAGTAAARTITGTSNEVTVTNGDGVSGNPTLSLPAAAKLKTRAIPLLWWSPPASNYMTLDTRNNHPVYDADTSTQETIHVYGVMPDDYAGNGLTLVLAWALTSATSGTLGCDAAFENLDTQDIDSDSFATAKTGTAATVPGTSGQFQYFTLTFSNSEIDGLAAGDPFRLRIRRDVANDNAAGDAELAPWACKLEMTA